jgi:hypothetical protein
MAATGVPLSAGPSVTVHSRRAGQRLEQVWGVDGFIGGVVRRKGDVEGARDVHYFQLMDIHGPRIGRDCFRRRDGRRRGSPNASPPTQTTTSTTVVAAAALRLLPPPLLPHVVPSQRSARARRPGRLRPTIM